MQKNWLKLSAVAAVLAFGGAAQAAVLHNDGFTDGTNGSDYRGVGSFTVDFHADRAQTGAIAFDLFGARSVDGDNGWQDNYTVALNGTTLFDGTFNLGGGGSDVVFANTNGFSYAAENFGFFQGGKVAVAGFVNLLKGFNQFTFSFTSPGPYNGGDQGLGDESWGVNNFTVETAAVPLPAALPLLAGAVTGLGALGLRRRKAKA